MRIAVAAVFAFAYGNAYAFHSGGVAECEGCHSMHNSFEGSANVTGRTALAGSGIFLLKATDQSGACMNCHEPKAADTAPSSYHISTVGITPLDSTTPVEFTPGGDFAWLKKTMTGSIRGTGTTWDGDRHGHNIIASDFGFTQDKIQTKAPGGTYPVGNLACSSCHDPHGKYRRNDTGAQVLTGLPIFNSGSYSNSAAPLPGVSAVGVYRLLAGVGYQPESVTGSFAFTAPAPDAVAPATYNRLETTTQTHVAYGKGMSEWCANCHAAMLENGYAMGAGMVHPAGNSAKLTDAIVVNYNAYVSSGRLTNVDATKAYSSLAPIEMGTNDYAALKLLAVTTDTKDQSASIATNVSCLSCHRAHASAFESATRFYLGNEFMTIADAAGVALYDSNTTENKINTGYNIAQQTAAYGGRPATAFGPYARNYCNKCHAKD